MGADIRWVCWDCKTVYEEGSDILSIEFKEEVSKSMYVQRYIRRLKKIKDDLRSVTDENTTHVDRVLWTLFMLEKWLEKHANHDIWLTNDYGLQYDDMDCYEAGLKIERYEDGKFIETRIHTKEYIDDIFRREEEAMRKFEEQYPELFEEKAKKE